MDDGDFTIKAAQDGFTYAINGVIEDGKAVARSVAVQDGDKKFSGSVEKLPDQYRDAVKKMLGSVGGGRAK